MQAYAEDFSLYGDGDDSGGVSKRTVRALVRRGWLRPEDPDDLDGEHLITRAGRTALGLVGGCMRKPKRMKTAVVRAIVLFIAETPELRGAVKRPRKLSGAVWANDEALADFSDALWVVDTLDAKLAGIGDDEEIAWSCVSTLVGELGFPCYAERTRHIVALWPADDDD